MKIRFIFVTLITTNFLIAAPTIRAADKGAGKCSGPKKNACEFCIKNMGGSWNPQTYGCAMSAQKTFAETPGVGLPPAKSIPRDASSASAAPQKGADDKAKKGKPVDKKKKKSKDDGKHH